MKNRPKAISVSRRHGMSHVEALKIPQPDAQGNVPPPPELSPEEARRIRAHQSWMFEAQRIYLWAASKQRALIDAHRASRRVE